MKKIFLVLGLLISVFVFADSKTEKEKGVPTAYSIKCYKCMEHSEKHRGYSNGGSIAERRFAEEKAGTYTMIYRCHYGHILYINTKTGERY